VRLLLKLSFIYCEQISYSCSFLLTRLVAGFLMLGLVFFSQNCFEDFAKKNVALFSTSLGCWENQGCNRHLTLLFQSDFVSDPTLWNSFRFWHLVVQVVPFSQSFFKASIASSGINHC
jgi:hypothetical protein